MAEEDVDGGVAAEGGGLHGEGADEWVAPEVTPSEAELLARRVLAYDAALAEAEEIPPEPPDPDEVKVPYDYSVGFPANKGLRALMEHEEQRQARLEPLRKAFIAEQKRRGKA